MYLFGTNFFKYVVHEDANWDFRKADIGQELALTVKKTAHLLDTNSPDLRPFLKRGGKLILYHGWCDAAIPAENTIDYYRNAVRNVGARTPRSGCGCSWRRACNTVVRARGRMCLGRAGRVRAPTLGAT
ncbi:MAG: tannase/feruloyl esterase family alpha/beta hydrolase [Acidobacteria bacterium]|nr:tannase/feruloyl esterase family alpha/beta hydrolase [Acidobacteriota bacterium]